MVLVAISTLDKVPYRHEKLEDGSTESEDLDGAKESAKGDTRVGIKGRTPNFPEAKGELSNKQEA